MILKYVIGMLGSVTCVTLVAEVVVLSLAVIGIMTM
jgi:hypothetical protein